jgi:hypothetical protein
MPRDFLFLRFHILLTISIEMSHKVNYSTLDQRTKTSKKTTSFHVSRFTKLVLHWLIVCPTNTYPPAFDAHLATARNSRTDARSPFQPPLPE